MSGLAYQACCTVGEAPAGEVGSCHRGRCQSRIRGAL